MATNFVGFNVLIKQINQYERVVDRTGYYVLAAQSDD